jgi:ATP-binding cassette subfamily B protein
MAAGEAVPVSWRPVRWLLRYPALVAGIVFGGVASVALVLVAPVVSGMAFDIVLYRPHDYRGLVVAATVLFASQVIRAGIGVLRQSASILAGTRAERDARAAMLGTIGDPGQLTESRDQALEILVGDARALRYLWYPGIDLSVISVGTILFVVAAAFWNGGWLVLPPVLYAIAYAVIVRRYIASLSGAATEVRNRAAELTDTIDEALRNLETIRDGGVTEPVWRRVADAARVHRDVTVARGQVERRAPLFLLLGFVQAIGFALALAYGRSGDLTPGAVVTYVGLLLLLGVPTFSAYASYPRIATGLAAASRVDRFLRSAGTAARSTGDQAEALAPDGTDLTFDEVMFGYPESGPVIWGADFAIPAGSLVVVGGAVGAGKSSLGKLMAGHLTPTAGSIRLGGVDLRELDPAVLARTVTFVDGDTFMFSLSIGENIRLGRMSATDDEVVAAARLACIDRFVVGLPDGYHTRIGVGGVELSGGERQRIALARAFLAATPIVVLDDVLSAVDGVTAARLEENLVSQPADRTIVVIADLPRIAEHATHLLRVRAGGVDCHLFATHRTKGGHRVSRQPIT